ncbi:LOW QUALITY PROTEIN: sequestosome-1-like [Amphiura filiformis]|uniref:LOW QUALITY PROTEIN: sequestosome-1-like n=1 Tax=Amphiura filiformis TaxID=82378 RepID=UPI003B217ED5
MSLTVKAYLKRSDNANPEIRRFTVDHDVTSSYEYLSKKVAQVFPSLGRPERFTLAWKDADNEMISFSSDEELMEALGSLEENVFRIYVTEKRKQNQGTAAGAEGEVFHPGVVCDGCDGGIRGPRFKCIICPDYDLCKQCEETGVHPEHEFVKFRKPMVGRTQQGGFKCHPKIWRGFGHPGWRHWWWQQQHGNQGPWGSHCHDQQGEASACGQQQQQQQGEGQQKQGEGQQQQFPGGPGNPNEEGARDFMQHVGEQVAQLLDPLGIDVDIETSIGGMRRKCHGGGRGWRGGSGCSGRKGKGKCKGNGNGTGKTNQEGKQDEAPSKETGEKQKDGEEMEAKQTDGESTSKAAEAMETEGGSSGGSGSPEDGEWTMVTEDKTDDKDGQQGASPQTDDTGINSAVEQLQAMGFDDDDGWLTHLVEAKGGDINRVLDAIRRNQQQ